MIRLYWPGKSVPEYLEKIEFSGKSDGVPVVKHAGFGLIFKYRGVFYVWAISGVFIKVYGAGMSLKMKGGGNGVLYSRNLKWLIQQARVKP